MITISRTFIQWLRRIVSGCARRPFHLASPVGGMSSFADGLGRALLTCRPNSIGFGVGVDLPPSLIFPSMIIIWPFISEVVRSFRCCFMVA